VSQRDTPVSQRGAAEAWRSPRIAASNELYSDSSESRAGSSYCEDAVTSDSVIERQTFGADYFDDNESVKLEEDDSLTSPWSGSSVNVLELEEDMVERFDEMCKDLDDFLLQVVPDDITWVHEGRVSSTRTKEASLRGRVTSSNSDDRCYSGRKSGQAGGGKISGKMKRSSMSLRQDGSQDSVRLSGSMSGGATVADHHHVQAARRIGGAKSKSFRSSSLDFRADFIRGRVE